MNIEFVSFEIAKKLKEKGFREKCLAYYDVLDNVGLLYNTQYTDDISPCQYTDLLFSHNSGEGRQIDDSEYCVDAPTISQVLKWLREKHLLVIPTPSYFNAEGICISWDCDIWADDNYELCHSDKKTYEEAALAGIEYVLDNLI